MFEFDLSIPAGHLVETEHEARGWMNHFLQSHKKNNGLGLDSETTGLINYKDLVVVWSLSDGENRICIPSQFLPLFKEPILENPEVNFDLTNAKFDAHMFANSGIDISKAGEWRDTVVMSWLNNENNVGRHDLKSCIKTYFGRETPSFEQTFGKTVKKKDKATGREIEIVSTGDLIRNAMADPERRFAAADYASLDAYNSTSLRAKFDEMLSEQLLYPGMTSKDFFYKVEVPFTKVLWKLERRGITVDAGYFKGLQGPMEAEMLRIEREFARERGQLVNLNSTFDVRDFFFTHLGKAPIKMTKGGNSGNRQPSTDAEVLKAWAEEEDPWALRLLAHRAIAKIHGTYVVGLQEWIDRNYRIHTSLNQSGTVTGRLSSSGPNLQNIPRPKKDKFNTRGAFIPGARKVLIVADYAQLEMRLMAHFSGDEKMLNAIRNGIDLHCFSVSEMYGIPYDEVIGAVKAEKDVKGGKRKEPLTEREEELLFLRQGCKAVGFGIIYGIGPERLAKQLSADGKRLVTPEEGASLIERWFGVFPGVRRFIEMTKTRLWQTGFVQTVMGRFRRFGDLKGMRKKDSSEAERQAVNAIIQGSAADVAKMSMLKAEGDEELKRLAATLLLQIHDELVFECPDDEETVKAVKKRVQEIMEDPFGVELQVPLPAEVGHGYSWSDAK